ncbi:MAG: SRPBCC family protein [Christensenellaceae bacterium]
MKISTTTAVFDAEIERVWEIVTDNAEWEWRSDLSKIEITGENTFTEFAKNGFPTRFTITERKNTNGTNSTWTTKTFRAVGREFSVRRAKNKRR